MGFQAKILVPPLCRVAELKSIVADATDVPADKQVLLYNDVELKNDSNTIATYGITKDCNITLNIKMSTGSKVARSHVNMSMLFMPLVMQQGSIPSLRNTIKQMTSVRGRPIYRGKVDTSKEYSTTWTPAKQMEHELTRNRMRRLLRTRTTRKILTEASSRASPTPTQTDTEKSSSSDTKSTSKSSTKIGSSSL
ncbi:ubiquitin family protein [Cooperia oncophora]